MKTEITRYLREREADPEWFDGSVLVARKAMKRLYALLHIRPGERAQKILFEKDPPRDSRLYALRQLAAARQAGRSGPSDRRTSDSVSSGVDRDSADDADGPGGADRADERSGADQQPRCV